VVSVPHTETEAESILTPYMDRLGKVFPAAWDLWEEYGETMPGARLQTSLRSRASLLNDFSVAAAEEIFRDTDVVLTDQPGFLLMVFDSKLHVRLKKFRGRTCRTSGIPTTQRQLFESQQPMLTSFPEMSNCVFGYVLKPDASGYLETPIKCSTGKILHWKIDVPLPAAGKVEELEKPRREASAPSLSSTLTDDERAEEGGISD
jgi:hypothetical protein